MFELILNEINLDNLCKKNNLTKMSVSILLFISVIMVGYWIVLKENIEQYKCLSQKKLTNISVLYKKKDQIKEMSFYKKQTVYLQRILDRMLKNLSMNDEMTNLLEKVTKKGQYCGLVFDFLSPMPEIKQDYYIELPFKLSVVGSYQQLAYFFNHIAQMKKIITWNDFILERINYAKKTTGNDELLSLKITAKIYRVTGS